MKRLMLMCVFALLSLHITSCSKKEDVGVRTVVKGNVSDHVRGVDISGYKIVLVKSWVSCRNFMCGTTSQEIATAYTDDKGNYAITFNYKLEEGESYGLSEQYYGTPYYPEYLPNKGIRAGTTNIIDINAWRPVELELHVEVLNNNDGPLHVRNEVAGSNKSLFNVEFIYEQNIVKTYYLRTKPDSDIEIIFWYYTGTHSAPVLHQKTMSYHTTLDDVNTLRYTVDCSTF